ncbi:MAG: hypothetical protein ACR2L2_11620 [Acidobacteriota bacterium]
MPYAAGRRRSTKRAVVFMSETFAFRDDFRDTGEHREKRLTSPTTTPSICRPAPSRSRLCWCSIAGLRHTAYGCAAKPRCTAD